MKTYLIAFLIIGFTFTTSAQKRSENPSMTTTNANYLSKGALQSINHGR